MAAGSFRPLLAGGSDRSTLACLLSTLSSFRELKDLVEMRPIYHRGPKRVRAHIFVAALAILLARALEKGKQGARLQYPKGNLLDLAKESRLRLTQSSILKVF